MGRWVVQATVDKRLLPSLELRKLQRSDFVPLGNPVLEVRPLVPRLTNIKISALIIHLLQVTV
jgi:hypothetical protein